MGAKDHVLDQYTDEELRTLDPVLDQVAEATEMVLAGRVLDAMTKFNQREKAN